MNPKSILQKLNSPHQIQEYLSRIPYNPDDYCRSAWRVITDQKAHCMEGALFAALALENLGHKPQLLHLRGHRDDDHVVALYQVKKLWGAVGKSNTTLLTYRAPFFKTINELVMSYFPFYFNTKGQMSLFEWAGPIQLSRYDIKWNWRTSTDDIGEMSCSFYDIKGKKIMNIKQIEKLPKATTKLVQACFLGANTKGLYKV